ncbi:hypothetical protein ACTMM4_21040 [Escherichia coli]|uniref:hypothetical protein n=1 Tax=Escherichia coli TaxID=562 RepID=UPI002DB8AD32
MALHLILTQAAVALRLSAILFQLLGEILANLPGRQALSPSQLWRQLFQLRLQDRV